MSQITITNEVNRLAACIAICLVLVCTVNAQSKVEKAPDANAPGQSKATTTTQSPELKGANELATRVVTLFAEGKYDEALPLAKQVLAIREKALGSEHVLIDDALYNLGEIYIAKRKYKEAEILYQRLLERYEKLFGPEHIETAPIVEKVGYLSYRRGDLVLAESLLLRARSIFEKKLGAANEKVATLTFELAGIYRAKKDSIKAESNYLRAIELGDLLKEPLASGGMSIASMAYDGYLCFIQETKGVTEAKMAEARLIELRKKAMEGSIREETDEYQKPRILDMPSPGYPSEARTRRVRGTVTVRANINESGVVIRAWAVCGPQLLRNAAVVAAYKVRFSPASYKGKVLFDNVRITYEFDIR